MKKEEIEKLKNASERFSNEYHEMINNNEVHYFSINDSIIKEIVERGREWIEDEDKYFKGIHISYAVNLYITICMNITHKPKQDEGYLRGCCRYANDTLAIKANIPRNAFYVVKGFLIDEKFVNQVNVTTEVGQRKYYYPRYL